MSWEAHLDLLERALEDLEQGGWPELPETDDLGPLPEELSTRAEAALVAVGLAKLSVRRRRADVLRRLNTARPTLPSVLRRA